MIRLFIQQPLREGIEIEFDKAQSHYLLNVMRIKDKSHILLFNGTDGEWLSSIEIIGKKSCVAHVNQQSREQKEEPDLWLLMPLIKQKRMDFLIEKATELGVSKIIPIKTERTIVSKINPERIRAQLIEASEQSGRLTVPEITEIYNLHEILTKITDDRLVLVGDENLESPPLLSFKDKGRKAFVIGPEGGWSKKEREFMKSLRNLNTVSLNTNILRAETAAIVGIATIIQMDDMDD